MNDMGYSYNDEPHTQINTRVHCLLQNLYNLEVPSSIYFISKCVRELHETHLY